MSEAEHEGNYPVPKRIAEESETILGDQFQELRRDGADTQRLRAFMVAVAERAYSEGINAGRQQLEGEK